MKTTIYIFISIIYVKISEAQLPQGGYNQPSTPAAIPRQIPSTGPRSDSQTPELATPQYFENNTPKCYPETAKAYFLPAPPSQPKVTLLEPNYKDASSNTKAHNIHTKNNKDTLTNSQLVSNMAINQATGIQHLPMQEPMLPDLIDEVPTVVQERASRLAESDVKVCNACTSLQKLPIFKFDKELLQGFLAGLGL